MQSLGAQSFGEFSPATDLASLSPVTRSVVEFSQVLNRALREAAKVPDADNSVRLFLQSLGSSIRCSRAYVFELTTEDTCANTYEWCAPGVTPEIENLQDIPVSKVARDWWGSFRDGHGYVIPDVDEYRAQDPTTAELLARQDIQSLVAEPLMQGGTLMGFFALDNPQLGNLQLLQPQIQQCATFISRQLLLRDSGTLLVDLDRHDALTGLYAVQTFISGLKGYLTTYADRPAPHKSCVVYLDIDNFKAINLERGFDEGDAVLRQTASLVVQALGHNMAARSGNGFYAFLASSQAEHFIAAVQKGLLNNPVHSVHIRAGICLVDAAAHVSASQLLDRARVAADSAKNDLVHNWRMFDPAMESAISLRAHVINNVDRAISEGWIQAWFQPVVNTLSGKIASFEVLARWQDPELGLLSPAHFIGALEEVNLVHKVDLCILEKACTWLQSAFRDGRNLSVVSFNLSRRDLDVPDIHEKINDILRRHDIPRRAIRIELTETSLLDDEDRMKAHLARFHADGYRVWLDDFGSGYSSFNVLQRFDMDRVKIDTLLLDNSTGRMRPVIESIVNLAKRLNMGVLAEGVETRDQYEYLRSIGCTYAQGYYISRPMPLLDLVFAMRDRGYQLETLDERDFYRDVGQVNVLDPTNPVPHIGQIQEAAETPMSLSIIDGDEGRTIWVNDAAEKRIRMPGEPVSQTWKIGRLTPTVRSVLHHVGALQNIGDLAVVNTSDANGTKANLVLVARRGRLRCVVCLSPAISQQQAAELIAGERDLNTLFDGVDVISLDSDTISRVHGATFLTGDGPDPVSARAEIARCIQTYIAPEDREACSVFCNLDTLAQRVAASPAGIINGYFHMGPCAGRYQWKRMLFAKVPTNVGGKDRYLWCVSRNDAGWDEQKMAEALRRGIENPNLAMSAHAAGGQLTVSPSEDDSTSRWNDLPCAVLSIRLTRDHDGEVLDAEYLDANDVFCAYLGKSRNDLIGRTHFQVVGQRSGDQWLDVFRQLPQQGGRLHEVAYGERSGEEVVFSTMPLPEPDCYVAAFMVVRESQGEHAADNLIINIARILSSDDDYERALTDALGQIGRALGAKRVFVMQTDGQKLTDVFSWYDGVDPLYTGHVGDALSPRGLDTIRLVNERGLILTDQLAADDLHTLQSLTPRFGNQRTALASMRPDGEITGMLGADDYDPLRARRIRQILEASSVFLSEAIRSHRLVQRLDRASMYDELTGLPNRHSMLRRIANSPECMPAVLMYADVNNLKVTNDTLGHRAGDVLLRRAAKALNAAFGEGNAYRIGGDEFVALVPCTAHEYQTDAERIYRQRLADADAPEMSLGFDWCASAATFNASLARADHAMYLEKQAKHQGRE